VAVVVVDIGQQQDPEDLVEEALIQLQGMELGPLVKDMLADMELAEVLPVEVALEVLAIMEEVV
jgi:hypothetical protein